MTEPVDLVTAIVCGTQQEHRRFDDPLKLTEAQAEHLFREYHVPLPGGEKWEDVLARRAEGWTVIGRPVKWVDTNEESTAWAQGWRPPQDHAARPVRQCWCGPDCGWIALQDAVMDQLLRRFGGTDVPPAALAGPNAAGPPPDRPATPEPVVRRAQVEQDLVPLVRQAASEVPNSTVNTRTLDMAELLYAGRVPQWVANGRFEDYLEANRAHHARALDRHLSDFIVNGDPMLRDVTDLYVETTHEGRPQLHKITLPERRGMTSEPRYRVGRHMDANVYERMLGGKDRRMAHAVLDEDGPLIVAALNAYEGGATVRSTADRPVEVRPRDRSFGSRPRMDGAEQVAATRCVLPLKTGGMCASYVVNGQCTGNAPHSCTVTWSSDGAQQHVHPGMDHQCSNDPVHPGNLHRCRCGHHTTVAP